MDINKSTLCPWCQSEIVWDPEIGPEDECPNCFNELNDYRSVTISVEDTDPEEEDPVAGNESEAWEEWDGDSVRDIYAENVESCIDRQEEAPECSACRELMLHAGNHTVTESHYTPLVPAGWNREFLATPYQVKVYLCPSCFKTETYLSDADRLAVIQALSEKSD
ncbi:hypothetical protein [Paenibacillus sp. J2TS4]|uniref:hypothetical protein n=1 Tax=Paenibacillus sp. J2TS4 TaxID=2807194 RepID=UPI001B0A2BA1|nr:hypothetical protein [Paenibacillus sp. J2TS4]GIP34378.1 hypothetical protein J2TS4_35880 [Paenibacillus sp. J2TS4]